MFIQITELKTAIYAYQIAEITEADTDITLQAIAAAESEVRSYLLPNSRKDWQDGRPLYDAAATLAATGTERNPLLVEVTKNIAVWYLIRLCHVDMIYEQVKERYDRAIAWLQQLSRGDITLDLPLLPPPADNEGAMPFRSGSRPKFRHDI